MSHLFDSQKKKVLDKILCRVRVGVSLGIDDFLNTDFWDKDKFLRKHAYFGIR